MREIEFSASAAHRMWVFDLVAASVFSFSGDPQA